MSKNCSVIEPVFISARNTIIKPPEIKAGTLLAERFSVIRKLHEGGVSSVYLARDNTASLDVALKIINCNSVGKN
jgi:serine/threonine protein kinase